VVYFIFLGFIGNAAAQSQSQEQIPLKVVSVEFTATPAPVTRQDMTTAYTRSEAIVTLTDGTKKRFQLDYRILHRSGDHVGGGYAALVVDNSGNPVLEATDESGRKARGPFASSGADGTSMIVVPNAKVQGVEGNAVFLINHLEYQTTGISADLQKEPVELYGRLPMAMNLTVLDQNPATGRLKPVKLSNVEFSGVYGIWNPCNSSPTPWHSHLGSEEYEPDASVFETKPLEAMNRYLGTPGMTAPDGGANPYRCGHLVEVGVDAGGVTTAEKHYAMGRLSFELGDVMPDRRTVYMGDDGNDVILAMFVADRAEDLSAGTLYAAKWTQTDAKNFGSADLDWIRLGHATNDQIEAIIAKGTKFSDIWETATPDEVAIRPDSPKDFKPLYVYSGTGGETQLTYYKLKPGMEQAAAFLETRRYAAWLGATTEFTKMEGQTHNAADKRLYTAISTIRKGMVDGGNENRHQDHINIIGDKKDLTCGAVFESGLSGGQIDTSGEPIASDWVATSTEALVHGRRQPQDAKAGRYDQCDTEMVANPDNLRYSEVMRTLFIGEDSSNHLNNFVWAYNVDSANLARIFSAPAGGENTGLGVYDNVNGHAYITGNVQHPGAAKDLKDYPEEIGLDLRRFIDERGIVGYFGGLPAMTR